VKLRCLHFPPTKNDKQFEKTYLDKLITAFIKTSMYMPTVMVASSGGMNLNIFEPKGPNKDVGIWSP